MAKFDVQGSALVYSTYLGGSLTRGGLYGNAGNGIAVDGAGNAYVTGWTDSRDFPTKDALQPVFAGGVFDAYVAKLNAAGSALVYSTYLGGSSTDKGEGIAVDGAGNAYVTGETLSFDFPTKNPLQPIPHSYDAFVTKLNAQGSALIYSTFLGGSRDEYGVFGGIAVDSAGSAYVTGATISPDFPTKNAVQPAYGGNLDRFVAKLDAAGTTLVYSTYLGGSDQDFSSGIAADNAGSAYVTGYTASRDFPITQNAVQTVGYNDAFVAKISEPIITVAIDIKPGNPDNVINPRSHGVLTVAILTTNTSAGEALDFDARQVDPASVRFGSKAAAAVRHQVMDIDHDGDADLLLFFNTEETGIACGDTAASLTGATYDGQAITGTDAIKTVGCPAPTAAP